MDGPQECPLGDSEIARQRNQRSLVSKPGQLPKAVLLCSKDDGTWSVFGAATLTRAQAARGGDGWVHWDLGRYVALSPPLALAHTDFKYHNQVSMLKPAAEMEARRSSETCGGIVNDHFHEFAATKFRVIKVEPGQLHVFERSNLMMPRRFLSKAEVARLLGVGVDDVGEIELHPAEAAEGAANANIDPLEVALETVARRGGGGSGGASFGNRAPPPSREPCWHP